jgi:hypothetical protein
MQLMMLLINRHTSHIPADVVANYKTTLRVKHWHDALIEMAATRDEHIAEQLQQLRKPGMCAVVLPNQCPSLLHVHFITHCV